MIAIAVVNITSSQKTEKRKELMQMLLDVIGNIISALAIITVIAIYISSSKKK